MPVTIGDFLSRIGYYRPTEEQFWQQNNLNIYRNMFGLCAFSYSEKTARLTDIVSKQFYNDKNTRPSYTTEVPLPSQSLTL